MTRSQARRRTAIVAATGVAALGLPTGAFAASFTVNSTADAVDASPGDGVCSTSVPGQCTLRAAIQEADALGGSSSISVPGGTYVLTIPPSGSDDITTGDLNVTAALTINGAGAASTFFDGGGGPSTVTDRVMRVESTGNLTLTGVTVQNGHPAGSKAPPLSEGGGILALGPLTMAGATVTGNTVDSTDAFGAGISEHGAGTPLSLTGVTVSGNTANAGAGQLAGGGGLFLDGNGTSPVRITNSVVSNNTSYGPGGGVYDDGSSSTQTLSITGSQMSGNHAALVSGLVSASAYGGALASDGGLSVSLSGDAISDNMADQAGGGILDNGSNAYTITNTTIANNTAVKGFCCGGGNDLGGGGIVANGGNISPGWMLSGDTISGNVAGSGGSARGGGIDEDGGDKFTIVNTTISGNSASSTGGGFEDTGGGALSFTNVTFDKNTATTSGGSVDGQGTGAFRFVNTILAGGTPANCSSVMLTSLGHNIDSGTSCGLAGPGDRSSQDPELGPLAANGGPTQTEALLPQSPAIDTADASHCPTTDQRGSSRPDSEDAAGSPCDVGAYESSPSPPAPPPPSSGGSPSPPVNTAPPVVTGTPLPDDTLACSTGSWTGDPTRFSYHWNRDGSPLPSTSSSRYVVQIADETTLLSCTVTASNAGGSTSSTSRGVLVAMRGTLRCPRPSGRLASSRVGPLALGYSRSRAREVLHRFTRQRPYVDDFCLFGGWGIRVFYPSSKLLALLPENQRKRVNARVIVALTANPFYALDGIRPGVALGLAQQRLHLGQPLHVGRNWWYFGPGGTVNILVKVRNGIVQELGVADKGLSQGHRMQWRLMSAG